MIQFEGLAQGHGLKAKTGTYAWNLILSYSCGFRLKLVRPAEYRTVSISYRFWITDMDPSPRQIVVIAFSRLRRPLRAPFHHFEHHGALLECNTQVTSDRRAGSLSRSTFFTRCQHCA